MVTCDVASTSSCIDDFETFLNSEGIEGLRELEEGCRGLVRSCPSVMDSDGNAAGRLSRVDMFDVDLCSDQRETLQ
jgi:hypothetical protein